MVFHLLGKAISESENIYKIMANNNNSIEYEGKQGINDNNSTNLQDNFLLYKF